MKKIKDYWELEELAHKSHTYSILRDIFYFAKKDSLINSDTSIRENFVEWFNNTKMIKPDITNTKGSYILFYYLKKEIVKRLKKGNKVCLE